MTPPESNLEACPQLACPTEAYWRGFLAGDSSDQDTSWIDDHLAVCSACRQTLDDLSADSWIAPLLQERLTWEGLSASPPPVASQSSLQSAAKFSHVPPLPNSASTPHIPGLILLGLIGKGGMGMVYQAIDEATGESVACKVLARMCPTDEELGRFRSEAAAVALLDHPHIVKLLRSGQVDGMSYFVMELVPNGSLEQQLRAQPLPPRDAARFLAKVARAIAHAHGRGVVHRDLKPSNILLGGPRVAAFDWVSGNESATSASNLASWVDLPPKIVDFGLAKLSASTTHWTHTGQLVGTPAYAAPEQLTGRPVVAPDPRCDVYSLGAILYQLLTGVPPLQADDILRTIRLALEVEPTPPRSLQPGIPRDLETICLKCLAKDAAARYHSAEALADDLDRFLERRPIQARRPRLPVLAARWARRSPWKAAAIALAAVVAVGFLIIPTITAMHYREVERLQRRASVVSEQSRKLAETNLLNAWESQSRYFMAEGDDIEALRYLTMLASGTNANPQTRTRVDSILRELPRPELRVMLPIGEQPLASGSIPGRVRIHVSADSGKLRVQLQDTPVAWEIDVATANVTTISLAAGPLTDDQQWRLESRVHEPRLRLAPLAAGPSAIELEKPAVSPRRWLRLWRSPDGRYVAALGQTASPAARQTSSDSDAGTDAQRDTKGAAAPTVPPAAYVWHLWALPEGRLLRAEGYAVRTAAADLCFESDPLAIITPLEIRYISRDDGRVVLELDSLHPTQSEVTPDRRLLATVDDFNVAIYAMKDVDGNGLATAIRQVPLPSRFHISRQHPVAALGSMNGGVKLIDFVNPALSKVSPLPRRGAIQCLRFDDRRPFLLVADARGNVAIISALSAAVVVPWIPHRRPLLDMAWTPKGDFAVLDESGLLTLWRWPDSKRRNAEPAASVVTQGRLNGGTMLKQFNTDGKRLLLAQGDFAEIWDVPNRRLQRRIPLPANAELAAAAALGNVFLVTLGVATPIVPVVPAMTAKLEPAAAKHDAQTLVPWRLLVLDERHPEPRVVEFQLKTKQPSVLLADQAGKLCMLATAAGLELWKAEGVEREAVLAVDDPVAAAFSPDGLELAVLTRAGRIRVWELKPCREIANWPISDLAGGNVEPGARIAYTPHGDRVCVHGRLGLRCWLRSTGKRLPLPVVLEQWISHLVFDSDGRLAVTIRDTSLAQVWDTGTGVTAEWQPLSQELRSAGHLASARFGPEPGQVILRQASVSTIARQELFRLANAPGSIWPDHEQVQVWDWRLGELLTSRHAFREFAHDWLADDGRRQFVGLSANENLGWPRLEPPTEYSAEWLKLLTRQYLHASDDIGSMRTLEPRELVAEWRRLRELKINR
jgi:WD40 repeat protein